MSMVAWSFLDLHSSYSGRSTSPRRAVSDAQGSDALEELDPSEEGEDVARTAIARLKRLPPARRRGPWWSRAKSPERR